MNSTAPDTNQGEPRITPATHTTDQIREIRAKEKEKRRIALKIRKEAIKTSR